MLKTNSKKVKERLAEFILQYADVGDGESAETIEEACRYIADDFKSRYGFMWQYPRRCNVQDAFYQEYAQGLCNHLFDFITPTGSRKSAWDVLKEMLEETEEEANKYSYEKAERFLCDLIYSKFIYQYMW